MYLQDVFPLEHLRQFHLDGELVLHGASFCVAIVNHYSVIVGFCFVFLNV